MSHLFISFLMISSTPNSFHTPFSFGLVFMETLNLYILHELRCKIYNVGPTPRSRYIFELSTLSLGFRQKSRRTCPRKDRGQDNYLREDELGAFKEVIYIRLKDFPQRDHLFLLFELFRFEWTYLKKGLCSFSNF